MAFLKKKKDEPKEANPSPDAVAPADAVEGAGLEGSPDRGTLADEGVGLDGIQPQLVNGEQPGTEAEADAEAAKGKVVKKSRFGLKSFLPGGNRENDEDEKDPMDRTRWWELILSIRGFENVTVETLKLFWTVSLGSEKPKKHRNRVRLQTKFTRMFTLAKGEVFNAETPLLMYDRKNFSLSYKELDKHVVKVDMWRVSCWTFNEYYGVKKQKLSLVANRDPNMELRILKKLSKKEAADKRRAKNVADVALFRCTVNLEEIFDFDLYCENWTLELSHANLEYKKMKAERKRLTFTVPRDRRTLPGQKRFLGKGSVSQTSEWNQEQGRFFWSSCGKYVFRGTRTHLQNSYFIVSVLTGNPPSFLADNATVAKLEKHNPVQPHRVLGRCLLNLTSVLDMSVFQGKVKRFTPDQSRYIVGDINGNVKCILRSKGMKVPELDFRTSRPEQLKTATTVSHLSKSERYLVLRVKKCESLPIADFDTGSSDPYLRCTWDNMVMLSPIVHQSLRPVFNQSFYFPVRVVFPEMSMGSKAEKKYQDTILKYELESKGAVQIQVWDDDVTSADNLGGTQVTLGNILSVRNVEKRTLLGAVKGDKTSDEEEDEMNPKQEKTNQWYEEPKFVRVYDGSKTALTQTVLANKDAALIHFEVYFYPDWNETLRMDDEAAQVGVESVWAKKEAEWTHTNQQKAEEYAIPFPDSIGGKKPKATNLLETADALRRFPCIALHPLTRIETPLMAFLSAIIIPEEWTWASKMLEWVHCLSFELTQRQSRTGLIPDDGWKDSEYVFARRKGAPQDHAMLLCSLLLGCKIDAYVVKGTIYSQDPLSFDTKERLIEHTWVMTRMRGWVTFWEPCSRQMFHLPNRYDPRKKKKKKTEAHTVVEEPEEEEEQQDEGVENWEGEVEDSRVRLEDMESLPTIGRMPKPKVRVQGKKKKVEESGRDKVKRELIEQREKLSIAPNSKMLQESNLVTWLPYDSIEVVFNMTNLWANRQNHHPACILYDLDGDDNDANTLWEPLLKADDTHLTFQPVCPSVSVNPELRPFIIDELQEDLRTEMMQNLQLYRGKKGMDTLFDHNEDLMHQLSLFLQIQELWRQIDPDGPVPTRVLEGYESLPRDALNEQLSDTQKFHKFVCETLQLKVVNKHGSPFFASEGYVQNQERLWYDLEKLAKEFFKKEDNFPCKKGKKFRGFPVHFCTSDQESIRTYLMQIEDYKAIMDMEEEEVYYTIECRVLGRLGGILSVWLYVGIQESQKDADLFLG
eukprot:TRINITY_DN26816_c0_g1_i1.p1 TRINITY_DN26816_c0_g1~~TRINITY_DN26816_c0_g1_i1.p1  ORF type:complete len:1266 (+),score=279.51 TRINITY_DN26816_c0_g1_i1:37-3798(+)